jgi:hypothetical protein
MVAQVLFGGEGDAAQVGQAADVVFMDTGLFEALAVVGDIATQVSDHLAQSFELERFERGPVETLVPGIPDGGGRGGLSHGRFLRRFRLQAQVKPIRSQPERFKQIETLWAMVKTLISSSCLKDSRKSDFLIFSAPGGATER